jgi:hypothetical protein
MFPNFLHGKTLGLNWCSNGHFDHSKVQMHYSIEFPSPVLAYDFNHNAGPKLCTNMKPKNPEI